jgi:protein-tyrosine phosphatase
MSSADRQVGPAVLFVCTGNICRSPAAEFLLRAGLGADAGIDVTSAGLRARVGQPVAPPMAALLRARGVDRTGFQARQFLPSLVTPATMVLTMTVDQRVAVVSRAPTAVRRTFTLREFAALALLTGPPESRRPADRLTELVAAVPRARARRVPGLDDDIEDPFGRPAEAHARALTLVAAAVKDILSLLVHVGSDAACSPAPAPTTAFG